MGAFEDVATEKVMGYTCEVNMAELYYKTCEKLGREVAEIRKTSTRHLKIGVIGCNPN